MALKVASLGIFRAQKHGIRDFQQKLRDEIVRRVPAIGLDKRAEAMVQWMEPYLHSSQEVLDIGGGWGFYDAPLKQRGYLPVVVDVHRPCFQKAPVVLYPQTAQLPFASKSFDSSLLITVLHHTGDPKGVLLEAKRVTRKRIIVIEDLYRHPLGRWWTIWRDKLLNLEFAGHPCEFRSAKEWIALFEELKLKCIAFQEKYTWLLGLRILNGMFVLEV